MLIVLGGLFGMHGLNTHGVDGMDAIAHSGVVVQAKHAGQELTSHASGTTSAISTLTQDPDATMHAGEMCLAILVASLLALLLGRRRSQSPLTLFMLALSTHLWAPRARAPDPPCLIALSIRRC